MNYNSIHIDYTPGGAVPAVSNQPPRVSVDALGPYNSEIIADFTGEKFLGGFGVTNIYQTDYWTLRKRSAQLFKENLYAKGLLRRLVTNEINTGLTPESLPDERVLGVPSSELSPWTELVESRFELWGKAPFVCDYLQESTFGEIQQIARLEALIEGDVLAVIRQSPRTKVPSLQLINGSRIQTPMEQPRAGNTIKHGVERDSVGRVVAYWVQQDDFTSKRLPAYGEKSGRRIAWLVFGTERRIDDVRGEPLLSVVLQSLKEIDRYRDSAQRKAVINSILAMFIKKTQDKPGTLPIQGSAVRRSSVSVGDAQNPQRKFNMTSHIPGVVMEELQTGEEPVGFHSQGTDVNFPVFEAAIINAIAWANEVPPEILTLAFSNNYSASQAAINEFKIYLNKFWTKWGENFCTPIYIEWLVSEALLGNIQARGFLDAWNDASKYDIFGAWTRVDWYGSIKPSTDTLKQARGAQVMVQHGWSTNSRESRMLTGTKFAQNVKWLEKENEAIAKALRPLLELEREFGKPIQTLQALANGELMATQEGTEIE